MIADGIHVHPANMRLATTTKEGPGHVFLVTDAMSTVGSEITEFQLNGRQVLRQDGRLTLEDGTLAGADLEMARALSVMIDTVGLPKETALAMATSWPAELLRNPDGAGRFLEGRPAHAVYLENSRKGPRSV
jgi:N-acetylglucosamine-6-phosphate deacetylase